MKNLEKLSANLFNEVLNKNLGGTFEPLTGEKVEFTTGYLVGLKGIQIPLNFFLGAKWPIKLLFDSLNGLISKYLLVGYWVNDGIVYIDVVSRLFDLSEAKKLGRVWNQISIWDCQNNKEIKL